LTFEKGDDFFPYPMVCSIGEFLLGVEGNEAPFFVVFPYTTHQFLFGSLAKGQAASAVKDPVWRDHVEETTLHAHADCCAVLGEVSFPLKEVLAWKTGKTFSLNVTPDAPIPLRCQGKTFFWGKMGQKSNLISLALERVVWDETERRRNDNAAN
jgi:flagellar motor switch protein FliM